MTEISLIVTFNVINVNCNVTDEGSVPEMRIWSILLIKSDLKWCIHLSRSLFFILTTNSTQFNSKLDYGCIVYESARPSYLKMLNTVHHQGLRLALGAFRTSQVESLYVEASELPLEQRRIKLSLQYITKLKSTPSNPAYNCAPWGRRGRIRPQHPLACRKRRLNGAACLPWAATRVA